MLSDQTIERALPLVQRSDSAFDSWQTLDGPALDPDSRHSATAAVDRDALNAAASTNGNTPAISPPLGMIHHERKPLVLLGV
jgi:hypothetical protein